MLIKHHNKYDKLITIVYFLLAVWGTGLQPNRHSLDLSDQAKIINFLDYSQTTFFSQATHPGFQPNSL